MSLDLETIGIAFDTSGLEKGQRALKDTETAANKTADAADAAGKKGSRGLADFGSAADIAKRQTESLAGATDLLSKAIDLAAKAYAAFKVYEYIKDAALLNARYETLGVSMTVVGKNAGYTAAQMEDTARALQKTGISMIESRQQTMRLVQAHIDLSESTKLARIAQDAAVIGNMNSSEAFASMIHGIQTGQTEVLRTIGLNISMEQSYKSYAKELHKTAEQLTQNEKTQAVLNAVIAAGSDIAGVYTASMDTAGKQLNSMKRYTEDLKTMQGEVFNEVLTVAVMGYTEHLKKANGEIDELAKNGELKAWGEDLASVFVGVANAIDNMLGAVRMIGTWAAHQSAGAEINKKYDKLLVEGSPEFPIKNTFQGNVEQGKKIEKLRAEELAAEQKFYEDSQVQMATHSDRIIRAHEARQKAKAEKTAKVHAEAIAKEQDYYTKVLEVQKAYAGYSLEIQQGAQQELAKSFFGDNHKYPNLPGAGKSSVSKDETAYQSLIKTIKEKIEVTELDIATQGKLTDGEKLAAKFVADLANGNLKLSDAKKLTYSNYLETFIALEKENIAVKKSEEFTKAATEANLKYLESLQDSTNKLLAQVTAQQDHNDKIGLSKTALADLEIAQLNEDAAKKESLATTMDMADWSGKLGDEYRSQAAALRDLAKAKKDGSLKEADFELAQTQLKAIEDDSKRFYDDLYRGLSDSLFRGFEAGKGFGKSFMDSLKNLAKTTVIKIAVQGIMTGVLGMGASGIATAQGLPSTGMSIMQSISTGKSLWDSFSTAAGAAGMAGSMGAGIAGFGNLIGSTSISAFGTGMGLSTAAAGQAAGAYGAAGMAGTGTALSAGSSVAAAMPYVAAAIAAFQASKAVNGDYRLGGLSADMGALLGFAPRLFGMADKKFTGQTVSGNLGTSNLSRDASWTQSGGLFRSDRSGTWSYNLADSTATQDGKRYQDSASLASDQAMLKGLNTGYDAMKKASVDFAKTLGINADLINARTDAMSFKIGATQEETDKAITEMFANVANSIAETVIPGIKQFAKQGESSSATLSRLALNLRGVNDVFTLINHRLFETSALGGKFASELVEVFGGLDKLQALSQSYFDLYFTDAEKAALRANEMSKMFSALNISMPQTKDQLRNMIEALDLNTESGRKTYASLMQIAPLFGEVADANAAAAKITAESLLATSRNVAALVPALDLTNRGFGQVTSSLQTQSVGLISVASLYEQASGKTVAYSDVLASSNATLTGAQLAAMQLQDQIAQLSTASNQTSFDFSMLAMRLKDVDTMTFVETVKGVFAALANSVKETLGAIATERVAIRNNAMQIISPSVMSRASIEQGVSSVNVNLPANAAVVNSQERVAQLTRLQASFAAREDMLRGMTIDIAQLDANFMPTVGGFSGVTGSNYPAQIRQAKADLLARQNLLASDKVKVATELPDATKDARKAQLDYAAAMQTFALEASKSVGKLSRLREETMRYFDAQKQLAGLMSASASGLRETIAGYRFAALDPQSQFDQLQSKYASTYAMALSTDGETLADYGGELNSMLNPLLEKAKEMLSGADYSAFASTALARAELIAGRLETLTPKNYDVESLGLLGQIDASLEALDNAARSADKLIIDAINAGAASTVNAINAKPVTQVDYTPVVAAIQNSSVDNTNQKLLEEIKGLRQSMEQLRYEAQATAIATKRAADIAERKQFDTPGVYEP